MKTSPTPLRRLLPMLLLLGLGFNLLPTIAHAEDPSGAVASATPMMLSGGFNLVALLIDKRAVSQRQRERQQVDRLHPSQRAWIQLGARPGKPFSAPAGRPFGFALPSIGAR